MGGNRGEGERQEKREGEESGRGAGRGERRGEVGGWGEAKVKLHELFVFHFRFPTYYIFIKPTFNIKNLITNLQAKYNLNKICYFKVDG